MRCPVARLRDSLLELLGVRAGLRRRRILLRWRIDSLRRRSHIALTSGGNSLILILLRRRARRILRRNGAGLGRVRGRWTHGALITGRKILVLRRGRAWLVLRRSGDRLRRT